MIKEVSADRLIQNELLCRDQNRRAERVLGGLLADDEPIQFQCECSSEVCQEHIALSAKEYRKLHDKPRRFIVSPGHQTEAVERVTLQKTDYALVEKFKLA